MTLNRVFRAASPLSSLTDLEIPRASPASSCVQRPTPAVASRLMAVLAVLVAAGGLAACGQQGRPPAAAGPLAPVSGGTLTYATDREPLCLDPHSQGDMPQVFVAEQFLDSLVSMDEQGHIGPWLATGWEASPDGLTYTFHLREDVRFTDGTAFDAQAVKANLDHIADPRTLSSTARNYLDGHYAGTEVIDAHTAAVHLSHPYAALLEALSQGFLGMESPAALQRPQDVNCQQPVGSGPFKIVRWEHQSQILLERNPGYHWAPPTAHHQGPAYLERIVYQFMPEPSVRFAALQSGAVDAIDELPPQSHAAARADPALTVIIRDRPGNPPHGDFNATREPFKDVRVREAFVRAADIGGALKSVYFGEIQRAQGPLSAVTPFHDPAFEHTQDYDLARANQLLDEAGWTARDSEGYRLKNGRRLSAALPIPSDWPPAERALWEQVQASTRKAGFAVDLLVMSFAQETQRAWAGWDYDLRTGYWTSNTPDVLRFQFGSEYARAGLPFHSNGSGYADPQMDALLAQALETQDPRTRQSLYSQAQKRAAQQFLQLELYPQSTRLGVYKTAHGIRLEPSLASPYFYDAWVIR